jgi:hypothetical protein
MDTILTTRLHGMVLALRNGVPPVVIDPIAGGAKVLRQAQAIGWPHVFVADSFQEQAIENAYDACLSEAGRRLAADCAARARMTLADAESRLIAAMTEIVEKRD